MSAKLTIGFLGAGKMAMALARGFIRAGLVTAGEVIASDPSEAARVSFAREVGAKTTASNPEAAKFADVLVLAVKPDQVGGVLADVVTASPRSTASSRSLPACRWQSWKPDWGRERASFA